MKRYSFTVDGRPVPKGSTHAFAHKSTGRVVTIQNGAKPLYQWQARVAHEAKAAGCVVMDGPVRVRAWFMFQRPRSHFLKSGVRSSAPVRPSSRAQGDVDKLARALLDALTGVAYVDDSQVAHISCHKVWAVSELVVVEVEQITE